jgi:hypothetical protein
MLYLIMTQLNVAVKSFVVEVSGANVIKLFTSVVTPFRNKLERLSLASLSRIV